MGSAFDWGKIQAEYVSLSLKENNVKPSYFTNKYGMKYQTLMAKKKKGKWGAEVAKQRRSLEAQTNKKVKTALSTIAADDILDEIKVRKRIVQRAQEIIEPIMIQLREKIKDKKELNKLGIVSLVNLHDTVSKVEMKAAGLSDKLDINSKNLHVSMDVAGDYLDPAENRKRLAESEVLATDLQGLLKEFKEQEVIDVEHHKPKKQKASKVLKGKGSK